MSAKNIYHQQVREALVADGWTITHDPLKLQYDSRRLEIDLGAENPPIGAEKSGRKIAVEVQSFIGASDVKDLQHALGQYEMYRMVLTRLDPDRKLYLAIPDVAYLGIFSEELGKLVVEDRHMEVLVFDPLAKRVFKWLS